MMKTLFARSALLLLTLTQLALASGKQGHLGGQVMNDDNEPLKKVQVKIRAEGSAAVIQELSTDENGNWGLNLPEGEYVASFYLSGYSQFSYITMDVHEDTPHDSLTWLRVLKAPNR